MLVSMFTNLGDTTPKVMNLTWEELLAELPSEDPNQYTNKQDLPLFNGVEYRPGTTCSAATALRVHFVTLDFDGPEHAGMSPEAVAQVVAILESLDAFLYTTWSHTPERCKFRALIRLSRPVEASDWQATISRIYSLFPTRPDDATAGLHSRFFAPFTPPGTAPWFHTTHGVPLDVDALLTLPHAAKPRYAVSVARLTSLAGRIKKEHPDLAKAMLHVARGEVFAELHVRDETIFRMTRYLAEEWPTEASENVASLFVRSLSAMEKLAGGCPTVKDVAYKVGRAQEQLASEVTREEIEARADRAARLAELGRSAPYSEDELTQICEEQGITRDTLVKRWLVQKDRGVYVLRPGGYAGPFSLSEVQTAVLRDLAPAVSAGVVLEDKASPRGKQQRKTWMKLIESYGTVAETVEIDLTATRTTYVNRAVREGCPRPEITSVNHPEIHRWLAAMGGHALLSWLAAVTRLEDCCTALFLIGAGGVGKSLLAHGLGRLWGTQPTPLEHGMGKFPDRIAKCPLLFADETLPKDVRGFSRSGELRELIQSRERLVERKFMSPMQCRGAVRIIVAANNTHILGFNEDLSEDDVRAIADRILYIHPAKEVADLIPQDGSTKWWVERGIAEHVTWLTQSYMWKPQGRFLIPTNSEELIGQIAAMGGTRAAVIQWLVSYLLDPRRLTGLGGVYARVSEGRFYLAQSTLLRHWSVYMPSRTPNIRVVSEVFQRIGLGNATLPFNAGKVQVRELDWEHILTWVRATEFCSVDEVEATRKPKVEVSHVTN